MQNRARVPLFFQTRFKKNSQPERARFLHVPGSEYGIDDVITLALAETDPGTIWTVTFSRPRETCCPRLAHPLSGVVEGHNG
jgi:hypothetical protein